MENIAFIELNERKTRLLIVQSRNGRYRILEEVENYYDLTNDIIKDCLFSPKSKSDILKTLKIYRFTIATFNVNKMISNEIYANRLKEGGLTFFEMGYMLMQAYDFVHLNEKYGCTLEWGGADQWGNIVAGTELGRKLNIPKVHPHKFRRTLATVAIDKGMPIEQVQHLLGHQNIDTTMQYAMVNQANVKNSHRKFIA